MIHIAGHAFADPEVPGLSGIVVAAEGEGGDIDLLTAGELARVRIQARLVVLSACDTGRGRLVAPS